MRTGLEGGIGKNGRCIPRSNRSRYVDRCVQPLTLKKRFPGIARGAIIATEIVKIFYANKEAFCSMSHLCDKFITRPMSELCARPVLDHLNHLDHIDHLVPQSRRSRTKKKGLKKASAFKRMIKILMQNAELKAALAQNWPAPAAAPDDPAAAAAA
eukprot:7557960-Pyramimonas_sp.AAC.1